MIATRCPKCKQDILLALIFDRHTLGALERFLRPRLSFGKFFRLPPGEVFVNNTDGLLAIDVAGDVDCHVIGNIVGVVELVHLLQRRVFQVFDRTERCLLPIRMILIEQVPDGFTDDTTFAIHRSVLFFIHGFKFGLEEAKHRVNKAIGFNNRPLFQTVSR